MASSTRPVWRWNSRLRAVRREVEGRPVVVLHDPQTSDYYQLGADEYEVARAFDGARDRLADVQRSLPPGVQIVVTYDRSELIRASISTLRRALIEEMIVVSLIIFVFLMHARSALVPILTLPIAVLLAFIPMFYQKMTINIMSLGGIAVAIGAMVDASIIVVENCHKRLEEWEHAGRPGARNAVLLAAMQEVGPSLFFALLVITVSFLPNFTLESTEGRLFKPLAFTGRAALRRVRRQRMMIEHRCRSR